MSVDQEIMFHKLANARRMKPAERFALVYDLNKFLRSVIIAAIHEQRLRLDEVEFQRKFLKRVGIRLPCRCHSFGAK